jgi:hypothetical protein
MTDRGRIVVVAAGFGLWLDGRCLAAGKWTDIASIRAYLRPGPTGTRACFAVRLRDGSEVEMERDAPGWIEFLRNAPSKLAGMPLPDEWLDELLAGPALPYQTTLFERVKLHGER